MPAEDKASKLFRNAEELLEPETVLIAGKSLPSYVNGTLLTNGPSKWDLSPDFTLNNFYDGYAMLSKYEIAEGNMVRLTKKYLGSEAHRKACGAGKPCMLEFCTKAYADPEKNALVRHLPNILPVFSDNGNLGLYKMGDHTFVAADSSNFESIDPVSLDYIEKHDSNKAFGLGLVSCHPLTDPKSGIVYNVGTSMTTGLRHHVLRVPQPSGPLDTLFDSSRSIGSFSASSFTKFGYTHSFGMSENYVVLVEQPYVTSLPKLLGAVMSPTGQCIRDWALWRGGKVSNRFFVVSKESGKVLDTVDLFSKDPFYYLHVINCYEEPSGDWLVIDIVTFPDDGIVENVMIRNLRAEGRNEGSNLPVAKRFRIPLLKKLSTESPEHVNLVRAAGGATAVRKGKRIELGPETLCPPGLECPSINPKVTGSPYEFFYGSGFIALLGAFPNSLAKVNVETKEVGIWKGSATQFPSQPIFIPNPEGAKEDDGVVVATVTDEQDGGGDFLLFLDGSSMKEIGRARFKATIPLSCHGLFTPATKK